MLTWRTKEVLDVTDSHNQTKTSKFWNFNDALETLKEKLTKEKLIVIQTVILFHSFSHIQE